MAEAASDAPPDEATQPPLLVCLHWLGGSARSWNRLATADWPLTLDELTPDLKRVEAFIGVSGPASYPSDPGRRHPLPPVPRNASAELMARACGALSLRATDAPAAVVSRDFAQAGVVPLRKTPADARLI